MRQVMLMRSAAVLMTLLSVTQMASAQEAVSLKFAPQVEKGTTIQNDVEVKSDQILTLAGMPLETHADTFMTIETQYVGPSAAGGWTMNGKFKTMQSEMDLPGGLKISFNSNNPDATKAEGQLAIVADALKATAKATWVAETNAQHEYVKVEYDGDPFADIDPLLRGEAEPENVKKARATELKRYPTEPVKPGDTWTRTEESDLGGGQTLTLEKKYTYVGPEERDGRTFDKVTSESLTVGYAMGANSPSPVKVTDSDLKVESSEGILWYDREAKSFTEVKESVTIKGTLTMEIQDQKLPGELDLTIATNGKTTMSAP